MCCTGERRAYVENFGEAEFARLQVAGIVAGGYETDCPHCEYLNDLTEVPTSNQAVKCLNCGRLFKTDLPEHAYG